MIIKPLGARALIQKIGRKKSKELIVVTENQERVMEGKVIDVGPECTLKVGRTVLFDGYGAKEKEGYLIVEQRDIIAYADK